MTMCLAAWMISNSPCSTFFCCFVHLFLTRCVMYCVMMPPFPDLLMHAWHQFHLFRTGVLSSLTHRCSWSVFMLSPIRKWPGVNAFKSCGSSVRGTDGLELTHASTCVSRVNSSNVRFCVPMARPMWCLTLLTPASQRPPHDGAS